MTTFFLMHYLCTETAKRIKAQGGCDCGIRQMRAEILCAVQADDAQSAARKLGGRCAGLTLRMDPDAAGGDFNDCVLHQFAPGESSYAIVLSSLARERDGYIDALHALLAPRDLREKRKPIYLVTTHLAG